MTMNDPLASVLSNIMNHEKLGKQDVVVKQNNKLIRKVLSILQENQYLGSAEEIPDGKSNLLKINLMGSINKVGAIKPRFPVTTETYVKFEKRFLPAKDFGVLIISTSKGVMTHLQAKEQHLGGRLICYCY